MAVFAGNYEEGAYDRGLVEIDGMGCAKLCERCTNALNAVSSSSIDECVARAMRKSLLGHSCTRARKTSLPSLMPLVRSF